MIADANAIALAEALYREVCTRMKVKPREAIGEIANLSGLKVVVLYDDNARLAGAYRVTDSGVVEFDGAALVQVRAKLQHRKVRS